MKILYICTHNRCRSVLSEAITNHLSGGKIDAYSAGSNPSGEVHPLSLKYLAEKGVGTRGLRSQSWHDFETLKPDAVVTVCDAAANETCPVWLDQSLTLHWGLSDPSKVQGSEDDIKASFYKTIDIIENRVQSMLAAKLHLLDRTHREQGLRDLIKH